MIPAKTDILHDGVSIKIYNTEDPGKVIVGFTDNITAYNFIKKAVIKDKGLFCNRISSLIFSYLDKAGVKTHFIEKINGREQLCRRVSVLPLQFIVRNIVAGSMAQRLGVEEGLVPRNVIYELCYKSDELSDPFITPSQVTGLGIATKEELDRLFALTAKINSALVWLFSEAGITLVDFKIEYGYTSDGELLLADDITPDTARFWDTQTGMKLDKDRYRRDNGKVLEGYRTVYERLAYQLGEDVGE